MPNITDNVMRVLRHLGLEESLKVTSAAKDRVYAWPLDDSLLEHMVLNWWSRDMPMAAETHHGTKISFREPGRVAPALQVCMHQPTAQESADAPAKYFFEIDLDYSAPSLTNPLSWFRHGWEVIANAVSGHLTDQAKISSMLDRRFDANG